MTKITKPQVSEQTMKGMAEFFMKTSVPRILEHQKKKLNKKEVS